MNVIGDIARLGAKRHPDKIAVQMHEDSLSYRELNEEANRLANELYALGIEPGDRLAMLSENSLEFVLVVFACAKLGAFFVPVNFRYSAEEIAFVIADSRPRLLFTGAGYRERAMQALARGRPEVAPRVIGCTGDGPDCLAGMLAGASVDEPAIEVDPDSAAMIVYTSGTTGFAKGVLFSHRAYLANYLAIAFECDLRRDDVSLVTLPLFHNGGLNGMLLPVLMVGASAVLSGKGFVPAEQIALVARHRVTVTMWVPTMLAMLVNETGLRFEDASSLTKIWYGSSPISPPVLAQARERFRAGFYQLYGMCEIGMTSVLRPEDHSTRAHCTGREMFSADMRIVDEDGLAVAQGEIGELISSVRPQGMIGYWCNDEATRETMGGGWIRTGDMARNEGAGYFTIVDRKKDMIISGGENIYPKEIENTLVQHPAVLEAACFGIPDPRWGETVAAAVVLRPDRLSSAEELIEFCAARVASYKKPRRVEFLPELPKNAAGKVLKRVLRAPHWQATEREV